MCTALDFLVRIILLGIHILADLREDSVVIKNNFNSFFKSKLNF